MALHPHESGHLSCHSLEVKGQSISYGGKLINSDRLSSADGHFFTLQLTLPMLLVDGVGLLQ